ncbi:MAG: YebC/PmpR family DNA-binding transcriptional regulator [Candidatus Nealsonbacteria bacterium]|nr:YebC/PmpR family DNA-binding transcriptional regulator [Candidatus Nealsonbacteria bacterium]
MSGHSHFSTIKRGKEIEDKKRGKIFSKIGRLISIAAKEGLPDPTVNAKLRMAVEKAKEVNMPKDNIERAIKKASGGEGGGKLEEITVEAFGPGGIALIITGITDNKNRAMGEIKQIVNQNNGKIAGEGSLRWQFERKGAITINNEENAVNKDDLEMAMIEAGADDIKWIENSVQIYSKPEDLEKMKKAAEGKGLKIESSSLEWTAKEEMEIDSKAKEQAEKLFEALDESDDVQDIYSNLKN